MMLLAFLIQALGLSKTNMVPYDGHDCSLTCVKGGKDLHSASLAKSWLCKQIINSKSGRICFVGHRRAVASMISIAVM